MHAWRMYTIYHVYLHVLHALCKGVIRNSGLIVGTFPAKGKHLHVLVSCRHYEKWTRSACSESSLQALKALLRGCAHA